MPSKLYTLTVVILISLFSACHPIAPIPPVTPETVAIASPARPAAPLTVETAPGLTQLAQLDVPLAGSVGALAFTPDGGELRSVYGKTFMLRRWDVATGRLLAEYNIGPVGMGAIAFDGDANLIATSDI